jgi:hypothetical protein
MHFCSLFIFYYIRQRKRTFHTEVHIETVSQQSVFYVFTTNQKRFTTESQENLKKKKKKYKINLRKNRFLDENKIFSRNIYMMNKHQMGKFCGFFE